MRHEVDVVRVVVEVVFVYAGHPSRMTKILDEQL